MRGARLYCRKPLSASHRHKPSVCSSPPPQRRLCTPMPSWLARPQRATLAPLAMRVRWPRHSFDPHSVLCSPPGSSDWWLYVVRPKKTFDGLYCCFPARFPSSLCSGGVGRRAQRPLSTVLIQEVAVRLTVAVVLNCWIPQHSYKTNKK